MFLLTVLLTLGSHDAYAGGHPFGWGWQGKGFAKPWIAKGGWGWRGFAWRGRFGPPGYVWEPPCSGLHAGFWRPQVRPGFVWVPAQRIPDAPVAGYWSPVDPRGGFAWQPGWFDGSRWVEGQWNRAQPPAVVQPEAGALAVPAR